MHGKAEEFVNGLQELHKKVYDNLVQSVAKYKSHADKKRRHVEFEVGDFVWAILTKDRFPVDDYNKLFVKKIGPVEIIEKINPNAYRLKLPSHIRTSDVFNIKHLIPYVGDSSDEDDMGNSLANFSHPRGNDAVEKAFTYLGIWEDRRNGQSGAKHPRHGHTDVQVIPHNRVLVEEL